MNNHHSNYPGHYFLKPEPLADPPWIRSPFSERGLKTVSGPP